MIMVNKESNKVMGESNPPFFFKGSEVKLTYLTADYILSKTSEFDIFRKYCTNFTEINKPFCSDLREDRNPDVYIFNDSKGNLHYQDFAIGQKLNCFTYVMVKYGTDYKTALKVIYEDLRLYSIRYEVPREKIVKLKTILTIQKRSYNIKDYDFWSKYGIDLTTLIKYNVFACKSVHYLKGEKNYTFKEGYNDPIYAYQFIDDGQIYYKIYRPYNENKKYKFLFNGTIDCIEGYDQLPLFDDILIITKSLKDCMVYRHLNYSAISLQGEKNPLSENLLNKLKKRFKFIILNYDNDETGIKGTEEIVTKYNLPYYYIEEEKDISDYVKTFGLQKAKELIDEKIKSFI